MKSIISFWLLQIGKQPLIPGIYQGFLFIVVEISFSRYISDLQHTFFRMSLPANFNLMFVKRTILYNRKNLVQNLNASFDKL